MRTLLLALMMIALTLPALAAEPDEALKNPTLEARAREISRGLRCLVCQGEAIDESSSDFARDLRRLVRERLTTGDSDAEVLNYLQARYGDFILLRPPLEKKNLPLWLTPFMVLGAGLLVAARMLKRRKS